MPDDVTIEGLQIVISQESSDAATGIDNLAKHLQELKSITTGGLKGLTTISKQLERFNSALSAMPNLSKFEQLRDILAQIKGIGNIDISSIVRNSNLSDMESAIQDSKFGTGIIDVTPTEKVDLGADEWVKYAEAVNRAVTETNAEFRSSLEYVESISNYSFRTVDIFETAAKAFTELNAKFESAQTSLDLLRQKVEALRDRYEQLRAKFGGGDLKTINAEIAFQKASQAADTLEGKVASLWAELAKLQGLSGVQPSAFWNIGAWTETNSPFEDFNNYGDLFGFEDEIAGVIDFKSVLSSLKPIFTELKKKAESFFSQLNGKHGFGAGTTAAGRFFSAIKRIVMYRAIRYVLRLITSSFKEGLQNVVQYSSSANTVVSNLTSKFTQLKNALGAMSVPLLQLITPALISLMNGAMQAANALNQVFSVLAGNSTYIKANTDYWEDYAKSVSKAKNSVTGFDELNKLSDNSTDYDSMFETVELDVGDVEDKFGWLLELVEKIGNIFSIIKQGVQDLDLSPLASMLGTVLDVVAMIAQFFNDYIVPAINTVMPRLAELIADLAPLLQPVLDIAASIINVVTPVIDLLLRIVDIVVILLTPTLNALGEGLSALIDFVGAFVLYFVEGLNQMFDFFETTFGAIIDFFKSVFVGDWESAWHSLANIGIAVVNALIAGFESFVNFFVRIINSITKALSASWTWLGIPAIPAIPEVSFGRIAYYEGGGFPVDGQLFIANEAGAEMVGSIGGHTAVANNDQIVESIKQGVYEAMQESSGQGGDWTIQIINDGKISSTQIVTAAQRKNIRDGKTVVHLGV